MVPPKSSVKGGPTAPPISRGDHKRPRNHAGQPAILQRRRLFAGLARNTQRARRIRKRDGRSFRHRARFPSADDQPGKTIVAGSFDDFRNNPNSVIIGSRLADTLKSGAGDAMQLLSPGGEYRRFTVAAIARSGVGAVDAARVYCSVAGRAKAPAQTVTGFHDHL